METEKDNQCGESGRPDQTTIEIVYGSVVVLLSLLMFLLVDAVIRWLVVGL